MFACQHPIRRSIRIDCNGFFLLTLIAHAISCKYTFIRRISTYSAILSFCYFTLILSHTADMSKYRERWRYAHLLLDIDCILRNCITTNERSTWLLRIASTPLQSLNSSSFITCFNSRTCVIDYIIIRRRLFKFLCARALVPHPATLSLKGHSGCL